MARHFTDHATKNFQRWKKSEDAKLKALIREGRNSEEIALEMGRTRASIMGRKSFLGIRDKMTPARGSLMPYTASSKNRGATNQHIIEFPQVEKKEQLSPKSLGNSLDDVIARAKSMGLKVNITISSEM